jgi:hypothetical protein
MSCCGNQRTALRQEPASPVRRESGYWTSAPVEFEYTGQGQLSVTGPLTGTVYRFVGNSARVRVHGSDAPSMLMVPGLRLVR